MTSDFEDIPTMKANSFVFISDFDGTITKKDFYWILLDDYIGSRGIEYYHEWKKSKKIGTEFLNTVFGWRPLTDQECNEAIDKVIVDPALKKVIQWVDSHKGDFWILSAGFDYYINKVLKKYNLEEVTLYTNPGAFEDQKFIMRPLPESEFYSSVYGIDKEKVALFAKEQFPYFIFAGDSEPDYHAAVHADLIFAKHELASLLDLKSLKYVPYETFEDIYIHLQTLNMNEVL